MKRLVPGIRVLIGGLTMLVVVLIAAGLALRIALHAREVAIPELAGMTVAQASEAALSSGLDLNIEERYYSRTVPAGRILSQAPAAGSRVRRGWQVRVTESLGPQQVTIPNVVGEPVREASLDLRRASLDLGTLAHVEAPGDPDMVLAQTPPPNAGLDQPRVNLLLSDQGGSSSTAFVMPSFVGMSYSSANRAAIALGLRVATLGEMAPVLQSAPSTPPLFPPSPAAGNATPAASNGNPAPNLGQAPAPAPVVVMVPVGPVTAQSPDAGYRGSKGAVVRLTFGHLPSGPPTTPTSVPAASPATTSAPSQPPR
ncbi:MAG TPA: PASTA domain-containing protein [Acidobacteriaceae bacterium]|jgi:beta-lactam-binding protein with PASTA domain|nr:PASTA domain-containing protein [Acidobacteriaceae bacterium]